MDKGDRGAAEISTDLMRPLLKKAINLTTPKENMGKAGYRG